MGDVAFAHNALLVVDIDGTLAQLCAAPLDVWRDIIAQEDPEPIAAAVNALARVPSALPIIVSTSRPESMRQATMRWLRRHLPRLADRPLFMRPEWNALPSWMIRRDHITIARRIWPGRSIVLVDDDEDAERALGDGDILLIAPNGWSGLHRALELTA